MIITTDEMRAEVDRIKNDPDQLRLVILCVMQDPDTVNRLKAIHADELKIPATVATHIPAYCLAFAIETHICDHALTAIRIRKTAELTREPVTDTKH